MSGSRTGTRSAHRRVVHCMGTVFSFDVREPGVEASELEHVVEWLHWVDDTFSTYKPTSQINRLARGELSVQECAPEVGQILARCAELEVETDGFFSAHASGVLDPSGLVKGWAIERASRMLQDAGSVNHSVNGGGDVQCCGSPGSGEPWRTGIAHPFRPDHVVGVAVGHDLAVATSGTVERGAHMVDPRTGKAPDALASVTLVGRELATVDAYATAAFVMGTAAPAWIDTLTGVWGLIVYADGTQWASSAVAKGR